MANLLEFNSPEKLINDFLEIYFLRVNLCNGDEMTDKYWRG